MFGDRGVRQSDAVCGGARLTARTAEGKVAMEITLDPSLFSEPMRLYLAERMQRWLDRIDPTLRLVSDQSPRRPQ